MQHTNIQLGNQRLQQYVISKDKNIEKTLESIILMQQFANCTW